MQRLMIAGMVVFSMHAVAQEPSGTAPKKETKVAAAAPAAQAAEPFDISKAGPWARKPADEKKTKKELEAFFKEEEALAAKNDHEALLARIDFPVFMISDDLKGVPGGRLTTKDEYVAMMKPFYEQMPKDVKYSHKPAFTVLSDSLVNVIDDFTMIMGKRTFTGRNQGLLNRVDGKWKWKVMTEAGWGGMDEPATKK